MSVLNRSADRLERALSGAPAADDELAALVRTTAALRTLSGPAPDATFVTELRGRLMTEALSRPAPTPTEARAAVARRAASRSTPVVVVVGRGLPRLVAGATASALLVGGVVGVASRSAVPGEALYPVKSWLDGVAVRLADNDLDRGLTYLAQAQGHISDARELSEQSSRSAADINVALRGAIGSVREGQLALDRAYAATDTPQALLAMRDFSARALPQVEALRGQLPAGSLPVLGELEALLRDTRTAAARRIGACGSTCAGIEPLLGPASLPILSPTGTTTPSSGPTTSVTVPGAPGTGGAGGTGPSVGVGVGGVGVGVGGDRAVATVGTGGATVHLPSVSATVPVLPSSTVVLPLPSATVGTGGVGATVPSATLGPVTLPGVTVRIP